MPGPMGERCEDCYFSEWFDLSKYGSCYGKKMRCYHSCRVMHQLIPGDEWWCEHFEDREDHKRSIKSIREISRIVQDEREQRLADLLDDSGIGKGKVN